MSNRCPPGVLCIENMTVIFLICILGLVGLYMYHTKSRQQQAPNQPIIIQDRIHFSLLIVPIQGAFP